MIIKQEETFIFTKNNTGNKEWKQIQKPKSIPSLDDPDDTIKPIWPQGRHFHSVVTYRNCMIICGGKSNGYMNDLYSFDFSK